MIEIENYREQSPQGSVVAIFDIYLPKMQLRFRNYRLIRTKKGAKFISAPSFKHEEGGKESYVPYIEFSKDRTEEFVKQVMEQLKVFDRS
jgi:hypothetical protein